MATQSLITTHVDVALREELSNVLTNIDPVETPFISNIGKGKTSSYKTEWLTDTLATAAYNQQNEAAAANAAAIGAGARLVNYITVSAKWFDISDVLEAADTAGQMGKISYQTAKALKELARDMEFNLINEDEADGTTAQYKTKGLKGWLPNGCTNHYHFGDSGATTNLLTEDIFTNLQQLVWNQGGKVDMVLCSSAQKRKISAFNGANRLTVNTDMTNKKIMNVVDFIENDFGVARVYLERHIATEAANGTEDATATGLYDWIFFLQKDMWKLLTMLPVKVEKLARNGLSQQVQISTTYTLRCGTEKANGSIRYAYNA